jgi:hypothetical protein
VLEWWSNEAEAPEVVAIEQPPLAQISQQRTSEARAMIFSSHFDGGRLRWG